MITSPSEKRHSCRFLLAALAATASAALSAAVPNVTGVTMSQANDRLVTITYTLSDAPAVITLDVQTNVTGDVWASIGGEAVWNAMGDVWKKVGDGLTAGNSASCTITWHPDHSWPDHKIEGNNTRAVVTAWALENTPDYMVVDLADVPAEDVVRYYPGVDFLPKKGFGQAGAAVTNNPDDKTATLLMRKIMARGIEWTMGSVGSEPMRNAEREATHHVTLPNNYYIGVFVFTQRQWKYVVTNNLRNASYQVDGAMRPMETISHNDMRYPITSSYQHTVTDAEIAAYSWPSNPAPTSFLGLLRSKTGLDFDLPSEAQWEFAARAGHGSPFCGDGSEINNANISKMGRFGLSVQDTTLGPTEGGTAIVGSYKPNDWGLYDVYGNVWEFCLDWFQNDITNTRDASGNSYNGRPNISLADPRKTLSGSSSDGWRVYRGGSWRHESQYCRSACRGKNEAQDRGSAGVYGVRVVCTAGLR